MKGNLILIHGGGPTAVINASLAGAIRQAQKEPDVDRILAAIGGTGGLMRCQVRDLTDTSEEELAQLERTPGSAIGTSRDALEEKDYLLLAEKCVEYGAKYVLMNGGNGTMDACGKLCRALEGTGVRVMGIPKTMDNDIAVTDHAPGFGSAARYIAQSVAEVTADVRGLPIHVVVIEASGRNAGWITAASALARQAGLEKLIRNVTISLSSDTFRRYTQYGYFGDVEVTCARSEFRLPTHPAVLIEFADGGEWDKILMYEYFSNTFGNVGYRIGQKYSHSDVTQFGPDVVIQFLHENELSALIDSDTVSSYITQVANEKNS